MSNPDMPSHPMQLRRILQQKLVSREVALEIARLIIKDNDGEDELRLQEPLLASEIGDDWEIVGSRQVNYDDGRPPGALRLGRIELIISQWDGQIRNFVQEHGAFPRQRRE